MAHSGTLSAPHTTAHVTNMLAIRSQPKRTIKLDLNLEFKRALIKLDTELAILSGTALCESTRELDKKNKSEKRVRGFALALNLKTELSFQEWEKEYNLVCALCNERKLGDEKLEQRKLSLVAQLSPESQAILEKYKIALQNAGNKLVISKDLKTRISRIKLKRADTVATSETDDDNCGLNAKEFAEFKMLCQPAHLPEKLMDEEQVTIEEYKLAFMKKMRKHLQEKHDTSKIDSLDQKNQEELQKKLLDIQVQKQLISQRLLSNQDTSLQAQFKRLTQQEKAFNVRLQEQSSLQASWYSWPAFYFLMTIDFAPMIISGVLYAGAALDFLPFKLPAIIEYIIGLCLNVTELVLAYSFIAPILKQRLGIADINKKGLPSICQEQLEEVKKINAILSNANIVNEISHDEYSTYADITIVFNQAIVDKSQNFPAFNESIYSQITRIVMTIINLAHNAAGVVFMSKNFLEMLSPTMDIISPLGIAIIAVMLAGQLASRYIYRSSSLFVMLNPMAQQYENTKNKLTCFNRKTESEFKRILKNKKRLEVLEQNVPSVAYIVEAKKDASASSLCGLFSSAKDRVAGADNHELHFSFVC